MVRRTQIILVLTLVAGLLVIYGVASTCCEETGGATLPAVAHDGEVHFHDAAEQAVQFIAYYNSIALTEEQEQIKSEALEPMPAPCCDQSSAATCCCPCNLSKATWGLANHLIADLDYDAEGVRQVVEEWIAFTNPGGYSGRACYDGQCNRPFDADGCGGMDENSLQS